MKTVNDSYKAHEAWIDKILSEEEIEQTFARLKNKKTVNYWRHDRMYSMLSPILYDKSQKWLTVGDGIGSDANWLECNGVENVTASDIGGSFLEKSFEFGYIRKFEQANAENLQFEDNQFDYVLCKEAYHHFPRPYLALYEMIRCTDKAIILIEPIDIAMHFPLFIYFKNLAGMILPSMVNKLWKNRFSYEEVGNYVYKISERELEKLAAGINLPMVAWKGINDFYSESMDMDQDIERGEVIKRVKRKIVFRDWLCKLRIIPYQHMVAIVFKQKPNEKTLSLLKKEKFNIICVPSNPYLCK